MTEYTYSFGINYDKIRKYKPPAGVNLNVYSVDNETMMALAQFVINSEHPDVRYRKYKEDLDAELCKLNAAIDAVRKRPRGQQMRYFTKENKELDIY